jgi:hypothetical protein
VLNYPTTHSIADQKLKITEMKCYKINTNGDNINQNVIVCIVVTPVNNKASGCNEYWSTCSEKKGDRLHYPCHFKMKQSRYGEHWF